MNYKLKFIYLILLSTILLSNIACEASSVEEPKLQTLPKNTIVTSSVVTERKLKITEFMAYSNVLQGIVYNERYVFEDISGYEWLIVRKETIVPVNLDEVKSLPNLSEDLINDFIEKNKSKENLGDGYEVKIRHNVIFQNSSLESFFSQQKKKQPRLKAIIGLSRVGFNANRTQSLVYVEYFNPERQLQKKYCQTTWKRDGIGITIEDMKWF